MSETIEGLRDKFLKCTEPFENRGFKVNLGETKVVVSSCITKVGLSEDKIDP